MTTIHNKSYIKLISIIICISLLVVFLPFTAYNLDEKPEKTFAGYYDAKSVFRRINYPDLSTSNSFAKRAIYETSALQLFKLADGTKFLPTKKMTREEALAVIITSMGQEASAIAATNKLYGTTNTTGKNAKDALKASYDGFLTAASTSKLISKIDLAAALANAKNGFQRSGNATRQELAYWLATGLALPTPSALQKTYMSYQDWRQINPDKLPAVEAVLEAGIMNGTLGGNFDPKGTFSKDEFAQILKNADDYILKINGIIKYTGTVERVSVDKVMNTSEGTVKNSIYVRNSDGGLHLIETSGKTVFVDPKKNELSKTGIKIYQYDFPAFRSNALVASSAFTKGDRIEYYSSNDGKILFTAGISSTTDTMYLVGMINSIDSATNSLILSPIIRLSYPDSNVGSALAKFTPSGDKPTEQYKYAKSAIFISDSKVITTGDLKYGQFFVFTIKGNVITEAKGVVAPEDGEKGIVSGIVQECNPVLGYLTAYVQNPAVTSGFSTNTYNFNNDDLAEVTKNGKNISVSELEPGDTIFFRVGSDKKINAISAVTNYTTQYAKIVQVKSNSIRFKFEGGNESSINILGDEAVISGSVPVSINLLKPGDNVKLTMNNNNGLPKIKIIDIQKSFYDVNTIIKGQVDFFDKATNTLMVFGVEELQNGKWVRGETKGSTKIKIGNNCEIYDEKSNEITEGAAGIPSGKEIYVAMTKDFGKDQVASFINVKDPSAPEKIYTDTISTASIADGKITMPSAESQIKTENGTIVVNNGKLISFAGITEGERAVVVATRKNSDGNMYAGIIKIEKYDPFGGLLVIRGKIKSIKAEKEFTLESYSKLDGETWNYANTPITFNMSKDMKILDASSILNSRDMVPYGSSSYVGKIVNVVSDGTNAKLVSTVPYGAYVFEGEVYEKVGQVTNEDGEITTQPSGVKLFNGKQYDLTKQIWKDTTEPNFSILNSSIVIKDGKIVKASDIQKGNKIRVYKSDDKVSGDAYIVIIK